LKAREAAHISIKNMTIGYSYCKVEKVSYSENGDVRTLNIKIEYDKIRNSFSDKFDELYVYILWPGSYELIVLFNPTGSNVMENAPPPPLPP